MNILNDARIRNILQRIIDRRPLMTEHIERIRKTDYRLKWRFDYFPKASTTWGAYTVHLAHDFFTWIPIDQEANFIHEAQHELDVTRLGAPTYFMNYTAELATKGYNRNSFEIAAEAAERIYLTGR